MNEPTAFLGISFRSSVHVFWFLTSMGLLLLSGTAFVAMSWLRKHKGSSPDPLLSCWFPLYIHGPTAAVALVITNGGSREVGAYSPDCIWWNTLMAGLYGVIIVIVMRLRKKQCQTADLNEPIS